MNVQYPVGPHVDVGVGGVCVCVHMTCAHVHRKRGVEILFCRRETEWQTLLYTKVASSIDT